MLAEALQGSADLTTTIFLMIGVRRSLRRPDHNHQFGHGREVYFWTLMSGVVMLTITATTSIYHGFSHIVTPVPIEHVGIAFFVLIVGLFTNSYAFGMSYQRLVVAHDGMSLWEIVTTSSLIEIKATFILDLLGSASALLGLVSLLLYIVTGYSQFDGLGAMAIGIAMAILAVVLMLDVKDLIVGRVAPIEIENDIRETALAIKGVEGIESLRTMYVGSDKLLVALSLSVASHLETSQFERLTEIIKGELKNEIPMLQHIHIELKTHHPK